MFDYFFQRRKNYPETNRLKHSLLHQSVYTAIITKIHTSNLTNHFSLLYPCLKGCRQVSILFIQLLALALEEEEDEELEDEIACEHSLQTFIFDCLFVVFIHLFLGCTKSILAAS